LNLSALAPHDAIRERRQGTRRGAAISWYGDETYLKVRGRWCCIYRAIDRDGNLHESGHQPALAQDRRAARKRHRQAGMAVANFKFKSLWPPGAPAPVRSPDGDL
jgi:hypothetical protein